MCTCAVVLFVDAYVSMQNVHSYSPQLYTTLTSDATLLKVIACLVCIGFCDECLAV